MWKIFAGFVVFALLSIFIIMKGGDKLDMQGEIHGSASETASAAVSAATPESSQAIVITSPVNSSATPEPTVSSASASVNNLPAQQDKMSTTGTVMGGTATPDTGSKY